MEPHSADHSETTSVGDAPSVVTGESGVEREAPQSKAADAAAASSDKSEGDAPPVSEQESSESEASSAEASVGSASEGSAPESSGEHDLVSSVDEPEGAPGDDVESPSESPAVAEVSEVGESGEVASAESAEVEVEAEPEGIEEGEVSSSGAVEDLLLDDSADEPVDLQWYILKVQSNRERTVAEALQRKMAAEGLDRYFGEVVVPTEKVTEFRAGKKRVVQRKLYPGYIVVRMHINDDTWFAVRETSGIGDFTGAAGKPTPMLASEVSRIIQKEEEVTAEEPKLDIHFKEGDRVKINEGNFENFEGEVSAVDDASGRVTVMINIFGRSTPVELEYWHLESV